MRTVYGPIFTLRPFERGIQETLGKYSRFVTPGLGFQIPIVHVVRVRDVREHTMDIQPQSVITQDNVEIQVDGNMWVRPAIDETCCRCRHGAPPNVCPPLGYIIGRGLKKLPPFCMANKLVISMICDSYQKQADSYW